MNNATKWIVTILSSAAVTCAFAQTMSSDQQVVQPKDVKKMTAEEKKADAAAKKAAAEKAAPVSKNAVVGKDGQVQSMKPPPKMTPEEKKADVAATRKAPTPEEHAKDATQSPG